MPVQRAEWMSTILKALQKAEGARSQETLAGRVIADEAPEGQRCRKAFPIVLLALVVTGLAVGVYFYRERKAAPDVREGDIPSGSMSLSAPSELPNLSVSGVIWDERKPLAVINGKIVQVGDNVGESEIIGIELESVTVRYRGNDYAIRVK